MITLDINAQIKLTKDEDVNNFLRAKVKAQIDNKKKFDDKSFSKYAINEYCKNLIKESGIDE